MWLFWTDQVWVSVTNSCSTQTFDIAFKLRELHFYIQPFKREIYQSINTRVPEHLLWGKLVDNDSALELTAVFLLALTMPKQSSFYVCLNPCMLWLCADDNTIISDFHLAHKSSMLWALLIQPLLIFSQKMFTLSYIVHWSPYKRDCIIERNRPPPPNPPISISFNLLSQTHTHARFYLTTSSCKQSSLPVVL